MNSPIVMPAPVVEVVRELASARTRYEERFGWPVSMEVEKRRLIVAVGGVLDAVSMPAVLGQKVLAQLRVMMLAGPVIAGPAGQSWTFLTQPATAPGAAQRTDLRRLKVQLTPTGAHTVIPIVLDTTDTGSWSWVQPPQSDYPLPPWPVVIGTTRRVAARRPVDGARRTSPAR